MEIYMNGHPIGRSACNNNCSGRNISHIDMIKCEGKSLTLKIMWPHFKRKSTGVFIKKLSASDFKAKNRLTPRGMRGMSSIGIQTDAIKRMYKRKNVNSKPSLKKTKARKIAKIRNTRNKAKNVKTPIFCDNCKRKYANHRFNFKCKNKKAVISENNLLQYISALYDSGVVGTSSYQAFVERVKKSASCTDKIDDTPLPTETSTFYTASQSSMDYDREIRFGHQWNKDQIENDSHMVLSWNGLPYPSEFGSNASSVTIARRKRSADFSESFVSEPAQKKIKLNDENENQEKINSRIKFDSDLVMTNGKNNQISNIKKISEIKVEKKSDAETDYDNIVNKMIKKEEDYNIVNAMIKKEEDYNNIANKMIKKEEFYDNIANKMIKKEPNISDDNEF